MEIGCPACAARYDVPDDAIRPGRLMRCARCGDTWAPVEVLPAGPLPEEALPATWREEDASLGPEADTHAGIAGALGFDAPEPDARHPLVVTTAPGGGRALAASWAASAVVLVAMAWGVWHAHARIERAWPPSERLFHLFAHHHHRTRG